MVCESGNARSGHGPTVRASPYTNAKAAIAAAAGNRFLCVDRRRRMLPGKEVRVSGWRSVASGALRWMPTSGVVGVAVVLSLVPACGGHSPQGPGLDAAMETSAPGDIGGEARADAATTATGVQASILRRDVDGCRGCRPHGGLGPPTPGHSRLSPRSTRPWAPITTPCHDTHNTGPVIAPRTLAADVAVPTGFSGGTISDGRYELVSIDFYPASNAPAPQPYYQRTVAFQANATSGLMVNL